MAHLPIQALSLNPRSGMSQMLVAAKKVLQVARREMLHEGSSQQPRLGKLIGHINAYDNAHQWCSDNEEQIVCAEKEATRVRQQTAQNNLNQYRPSNKQSSSTLKLRTLAEFQEAIRNHLEAETQTVVTTEEVIADDDFENEEAVVDSDDTLNNDSDEDSDWSDDEDPIIDFIRKGTRILLTQDATLNRGNDLTTSEMLPKSQD